MPGSPVPLGPFTGGLATRADITAVEDNECIVAQNFQYSLAGVLTARTPITQPSYLTSFPGTGFTEILMYATMHYDPSMTNVLLVSTATNLYAYYDATWATIDTIPISYTEAAYYYKTVWLPKIPTVIDSGGVWQPGMGTVSRLASMPTGNTITTYKERVWVAGDPDNPYRLYYSHIAPTGDESDWDASQFVEVDSGDGEPITKIVSYQDTLLIFKKNKTYILTYADTIDGMQISNISRVIGADNIHAVTWHLEALYVFHEAMLFRLQGTNFVPVSEKVNFTEIRPEFWASENYFIDTSKPVAISSHDKKILVWYYGTIYVYNTVLEAWTSWESDTEPYRWVTAPKNEFDIVEESVCNSLTGTLYEQKNVWNAIDTENFTCVLTTKMYSFDPAQYKRMFWWAVEAGTDLDFKGGAFQTAFNRETSWGDVQTNYTWDELTTQTWGDLKTVPFTGWYDPIPTENLGQDRKIYKMRQSLRFRSIFFRIELESDGTDTTGPQRLFNITPIIKGAETVVKRAS